MLSAKRSLDSKQTQMWTMICDLVIQSKQWLHLIHVINKVRTEAYCRSNI